MNLTTNQNVDTRTEGKNKAKVDQESSFAELEFHPKVPITDNDQSISVVQEFTEEKPNKKIGLRFDNCHSNLDIYNDKKKDSLK